MKPREILQSLSDLIEENFPNLIKTTSERLTATIKLNGKRVISILDIKNDYLGRMIKSLK